MNKRISIFTRMITAVLCLAAVILIFGSGVDASAAGRLSSAASKYWINGTGTVEITLADRAEGEAIEAYVTGSSRADISVGDWDGDSCNITVTAKSNKYTYLKVSFGDEELKIKLYLKIGEKMTSEEVYAYARNACVEIKTWDSQENIYVGTGFFVGNGMVLTNYHVVSSASKMTITDYDGKEYKIKSIYGYNEDRDLILIKVSATNKNALSTADDVHGGEKTYSFGSPVGMTGSYSTGVVSNPNPQLPENDENNRKGTKYIQLAMPSGIGSGGGPVLNSEGHVIGVMTLIVPAAQNLCLALDYGTIDAFLSELTPDMALSTKAFYKQNKGKVKESNNYEIVTSSNSDNNASMYAPIFDELTPEEIYEKTYDSMAEIYVHYNAIYLVADGSEPDYFNGSGFFISPDCVVTNNHVIAGDTVEIWVQDYSGRKYTIESMQRSEKYDLAILKVSCKDGLDKHTYVDVATGYIPACGETVYCFGSPLGYTATFSEGTVRMSTRVFNGVDHINFSTPIFSGSSGGALLNKYGKVIGITTRLVLDVEDDNLAVMAKYLNNLEG